MKEEKTLFNDESVLCMNKTKIKNIADQTKSL